MPRPKLVPLERRALKEAQAMQRHFCRSKPETVDATRRLLYLCKAADLVHEPLYCGPALQRAIWRYEALWLPLLLAVSPAHARAEVLHCTAFARTVDELRAKNAGAGAARLQREDLVPPLDVAWVWHCHRLNPEAYAAEMAGLTDCGAGLETTFEDAFRFSDGEDAQSVGVRLLWENAFPFEPFMPKYLLSRSWADEEKARRETITAYANEMARAAFKPKIDGVGIARVAGAQRTFLWQVVGQAADAPPALEALIETNEYLSRAYDRYLLFLALHRRVPPDTLLVPMSDINVVWHAHLSCSTEYGADTRALLGCVLPHDTAGVEDRRKRRVDAALAAALAKDAADAAKDAALVADIAAAGPEEVARANEAGGVAGFALDHERDEADELESLGLPSVELAEMDEKEVEAMREKRRRGISVRETKAVWEAAYGASPKYDLPDTCYRGEPDGERGGFHAVFEAANGTSHDISWVRALVLMVAATVVAVAGLAIAAWAFFKTMLSHGKYLVALPVGLGVSALGVYLFLAIPINRPLSSTARFWIDRNLKQTHNPLPPYLISSTKKLV